jgi:signal-transduction protein with cAMP-binding, CBS, and nucleotidyltransferase domain
MSTVESVERIIRKDGRMLTIGADADVVTAAREMHGNQVGCLVVVDGNGKIIGIVTERDILSKVVAKGANPQATAVKSIMSESVLCCRTGTSMTRARRTMAQHRIRHLPIIEDGVPIGMISSRDILAHELSTTRAIARHQSKILQELEAEFPGITQLRRDVAGRVVI